LFTTEGTENTEKKGREETSSEGKKTDWLVFRNVFSSAFLLCVLCALCG
jgi:hypothetical protein